jgi:WD40 repeat protein
MSRLVRGFLTVGVLALLSGQAAPETQPRPSSPDPVSQPLARSNSDGELLPPGAIARLGDIRLRMLDGVNVVALAPDGSLAAAVSQSSKIVLWETKTGKRRAVLARHSADVRGLAFSPDGKVLASTSAHMDEIHVELRLWDTMSCNEILVITAASHTRRPAFSPDGKTVAALDSRGGVQLWDVSTGQPGRRLAQPATTFCSFAFAPDGTTLAAGGDRGSICLLDMATGKERCYLAGHKHGAGSLAFSPDGQTLASGSGDCTIRLWDITTGEEKKVLETQQNATHHVAFASDGKTLLADVGGQSIARFEVATGKELFRWKDQFLVRCLSISANGQLAAVGSYNGPHALRLLDLETGKELFRSQGHPGAVGCAAFSSDGKTIASCSWTQADGSIRLWDSETGSLVRELKGHKGGVAGIAWSPDGKALASVANDRTVCLWDLAAAKVVRTLSGNDANVNRLAFSSDGKLLATGDFFRGAEGQPFGTVRLWDPHTGKLVTSSKAHPLLVHALASCPGKTLLVSAGDRAHLWDARVGPLREKIDHLMSFPRSVALSPDGWLVACGVAGPALAVYETLTGKEVMVLPGHVKFVTQVAFSPDGQLLASAGGDGLVVVRNAATGESLQVLRGDVVEAVYCLAFSPDGHRLVTGGADSTLLVWDLTAARRNLPAWNAVDLGREELTAHWNMLLEPDAARAYQAVHALITARQTVPFFKQVLSPVPAPDDKRLVQLITDLDSDQFEVREKASRELERSGEAVAAALRKVLAGKPSAEVRRSAGDILEKLEGTSPEQLQALRALIVLDRIGDAHARQLLETVARGAPDAPLTRQAQALLARRATTR